MLEWVLLVVLACFFSLALVLVMYPLRLRKSIILGLTSILIIVVSSAYWHWGAFATWHHFLNDKANQQQIQALLQSINSPEELITKLKKRLDQQPDSAKGWYLLGRLYVSQNQWKPAYQAFATAKKLQPDDEQININFAQSMWQLNNQAFNQAIRAEFQAVLKHNSQQPDALAMLAMDAFLSHDYYLAIGYWNKLLDIIEPGSDDALAVKKAIAQAEQQLRQ